MPSTNVSVSGKNKACLKKFLRNWQRSVTYKICPLIRRVLKCIKTPALKKELIGKRRSGNTTKIHAVTDGLGNPVKVNLTAGQVHDVTVASALISEFKTGIMMADAAYDSDKLRDQIRSQGAIACIKPRRNRKVDIPFDKEQYKERHLVECFFHKLKRYQRIATRYDKFAVRFLAFIHVACILIWLL